MKKSKYSQVFKMTCEILDQKPKTPIAHATEMSCNALGIVYSENVRKSINARLVKIGRAKGNSIPKELVKAKRFTFDKSKDSYIITYAQNGSPVHKNFWKNVLSYANYKDSGLHVIAGMSGSLSTSKWAKEVLPYLDSNRQKIHKKVQILSDIRTTLTSANPLSGIKSITLEESCIIGHPRQHFESLPVLEGYSNKMLLSTGACTVPNYTNTIPSKKAEANHIMGFVLIEKDGEDFHVRQIEADKDGNFYNGDDRVKDGKVRENKKGVEAVILGDIHVRHTDKKSMKAAFDFIDKHKPNHIVAHDVAEMESILHWDLKDPFRLMQKSENKLDSLYDEIGEIMDWIRENKHRGKFIFARSNHDDMLDRWLKFSDWRSINPKNKKAYLELSNILANEKVAQKKGVLPFLIDREFGDEVATLSLDDSYKILGWECAMHGHVGANGSRGSAGQYKNLNVKNIVGHRHTPFRGDRHFAVGTLSWLRVGFNRGPSSWMNGFGVIYPDGKAQLIHIIKGKIKK